MSEKQTKPVPKHVVRQGVAYALASNGRLVRTYVVLGGKRVYVDARPGDELTKKQANT